VNDQTVHSFSTTVSFGARSSADLFDYLASAAEFILRLCVTQADALARYADDQIACVRPLPAGPDWQKFQRMKQQVCNTCIALGIPIDKFAEGTSVEYLGTGADSAAMIAFIQKLAGSGRSSTCHHGSSGSSPPKRPCKVSQATSNGSATYCSGDAPTFAQ
jgi:hypothetical protein